MVNPFIAQLTNLNDPWKAVANLERFVSLPRRQLLLYVTFIILAIVTILHYYLLIPLPYRFINAGLLWLGAFELGLLASVFYTQSKFNRFYFNKHGVPTVAFEVSLILRTGPLVTKNLLKSVYGKQAALVLNITQEKWSKLINQAKSEKLIFTLPAQIDLGDLAQIIYDQSAVIRPFLDQIGLSRNDWKLAFTWSAFNNRLTKRRSRWYAKENLDRFVNLTASFRVSLPPILKNYLRPISEVDRVNDWKNSLGSRHDEVLALEQILGSNYRHNVLLQSHSAGAAEEIITEFESLIDRGMVTSSLKGHSLYLLPAAELLAKNLTAEDFIKEALHLFRALLSTSRLILVIDDLPLLLNRALSLKVSLPKLFGQILHSDQVSFVILSHSEAEKRALKEAGLADYFQAVIVADLAEGAVYRMLWYKFWSLRKSRGLIFTVGAMRALVEKGKLNQKSLQDAVLAHLSQTLINLPAGQLVVEAKDIQ